MCFLSASFLFLTYICSSLQISVEVYHRCYISFQAKKCPQDQKEKELFIHLSQIISIVVTKMLPLDT